MPSLLSLEGVLSELEEADVFVIMKKYNVWHYRVYWGTILH